MRGKTTISSVFYLLCSVILLAGCDQTFNPIQKNDMLHFSIYGYLDASADTQWVRVGTIRQDIDESPDPTGIRVTLEDVQSGETVLMKDSLFTKGLLNYWSTMDIENEQTYRIKAEGIDGNASTVTVTTPTEVPSVYIVLGQKPPGFYIYIDDSVEGNFYGVEHIADVQSVWYVILKTEDENQRRIFRFPLRNTLKYTRAYFGAYYAFAKWEEEREQIEKSIIGGDTEMIVASRQFFVAFGGPEWDGNISSIVDLEYFVEGTAANVENGLGYAVGIDAKWFRQRSCLAPDSSASVTCIPDDGPFWYHE